MLYEFFLTGLAAIDEGKLFQLCKDLEDHSLEFLDSFVVELKHILIRYWCAILVVHLEVHQLFDPFYQSGQQTEIMVTMWGKVTQGPPAPDQKALVDQICLHKPARWKLAQKLSHQLQKELRVLDRDLSFTSAVRGTSAELIDFSHADSVQTRKELGLQLVQEGNIRTSQRFFFLLLLFHHFVPVFSQLWDCSKLFFSLVISKKAPKLKRNKLEHGVANPRVLQRPEGDREKREPDPRLRRL
mmetsp:Transcript_14629/g.41807  ORF Transcript_14629/g.41807 Transcript_14629/m.41807 type:complete len:242 (+) Transcript_14629:295-1020(+)